MQNQRIFSENEPNIVAYSYGENNAEKLG